MFLLPQGITRTAFIFLLSFRCASCFVSGEEFYADGMPMCAHRSIVAGCENGNETGAEAAKVLGYCHKIVQGH